MKRTFDEVRGGESARASHTPTTVPPPSSSPSVLSPRDSSWVNFNAFCAENEQGATPSLFPSPNRSVAPNLRYVSSSEFDARLESFCEKIRDAISDDDGLIGNVLLWVQEPGKSNFWMNLKCWPFLKEIVDEVWYWGRSSRNEKIYHGLGDRTAHIILDDALFTGEQMSKQFEDHYRIAVPFGFEADSEHLFVISAFAISSVAETRIERAMRYGSDCANSEDEEEYAEEMDSCDRLDDDFVSRFRGSTFVSEITLEQAGDGEHRYLYYTGFKVPDDFSIPLLDLVVKGAIPNLSMDALATNSAPITVKEPLPHYKNLPLTWKGKSLEQKQFAALLS